MVYNRVFTAMAIGARIFGRSVSEAWRQAAASSQHQRANRVTDGSSGGGSSAVGGAAAAAMVTKMSMEEACKILDVRPPGPGNTSLAEVTERYKQLFDANDPTKGGSFYLQSKVVRARERIEHEVRPMQHREEQEAEIKKGWNPNFYKKP